MCPPPSDGCTPPAFADDDGMKQCHEAKKAALDGDAEPKGCVDTFKSCAHDAMAKSFAALCEEKLAACAATPAAPGCAKITELCSHGL